MGDKSLCFGKVFCSGQGRLELYQSVSSKYTVFYVSCKMKKPVLRILMARPAMYYLHAQHPDKMSEHN